VLTAAAAAVLAPAGAGSAQPAGASGGTVSVSVDAAHPGLAVNEGLIGANHVPADASAALQRIGLRWARTDVSFEASTSAGPVYDCATGAWDPSFLDSEVAADRSAGAEPLLIVDYTPDCLATNPPPGSNPNYAPPDVGPDQARWKALVTQMALHEITAEGVRHFEVWNEPDGLFWTGGLQGYLDLYADTSEALEQAAAQAGEPIEVGGPALTDFLGLDTSWISALASEAVADHLPLDFLSWHLYADDPDLGPSGTFPDGLCLTGPPPPGLPCWYNPKLDARVYGAETEQARAVLAAYPSLHPALWIDEWNVNAGEDARQDGPYGAAFVAAALDSAQSAGLDRMAFYDVVDSTTDPTANFGFLFSNLTPKPSYYAFEMWRRLAGRLLPVGLSPDQSGADAVGRVGAVASAREDGTVRVLLYDFAPYDPTGGYGTVDPNRYDHPVTVSFSGLRERRYEVTRQVVDATRPGGTAEVSQLGGRSPSDSFTLSGESVTLLTLRPFERGCGHAGHPGGSGLRGADGTRHDLGLGAPGCR
jgi:hypothetical protein